jgi:hypothetical protein
MKMTIDEPTAVPSEIREVKAARKPRRTATQKRFDDQASGLFDAMYEEKDLCASCSSIDYAVFEAVGRDCVNNHTTEVKDLLPKAIEMAKNRDKFTASWDWKANEQEILGALNYVLRPHGLAFQEPDCDAGCDFFEFELVRIPSPDEPQYREPKEGAAQ